MYSLTMPISIRKPWCEHTGVVAIAAGSFILWLLLAPTVDASAAVEGLILAAAVTVWSRLADL